MKTYHIALKRKSLYWFTIQAESDSMAFQKFRTMHNGEYKYTTPYAFYPSKD